MSHLPDDLGSSSMLELFRAEAETQCAVLTAGLLELEKGEAGQQIFELLMRAAHSMKGAARIVNLPDAAAVAHALEDCFVAAHRGSLALNQRHMDLLLSGVDLVSHMAKRSETDPAIIAHESARVAAFLNAIQSLLPPASTPETQNQSSQGDTALFRRAKPGLLNKPGTSTLARGDAPGPKTPARAGAHRNPEAAERVLRLAPENLNRLLGLASESLVDSRWLRPFADSFQQLKRHQAELGQQLESLRQTLDQEKRDPAQAPEVCAEAVKQLAICQKFLSERLQDLALFDRRSAHLSQRLYLEVLRTRMRPFSDAVRRFPRMVRDLAKSLGKQVSLEVAGEGTQVDREILERLETPLAHLLRNAVDHGCESPTARESGGKSAEAVIRIEARHSAGVLLVTVSDDGAGVDLEQLRVAIVRKRFAAAAVAARFSESELLEFLFLPGFSLKSTVTELSGRGFGLDIVQNMVKSVRGGIRVINQRGAGLRVQLQLPLTLSVLRALLVQVAGEPYAIPLAQISRTLQLSRSAIGPVNGGCTLNHNGEQLLLVQAPHLFGSNEGLSHGEELPVVILGERSGRCGLIVDRLIGERELVVQPLDRRLGKVKNISAAALTEDGAPILIVDVEETIRSMEKLLADGGSGLIRRQNSGAQQVKRVLAVDDSVTVREMERQLLSSHGYVTEVAADGMEAWTAVRSGTYDLVITDLDMPRMDGVELTNRIKKDPNLSSIPVVIISYKDREEDRQRGLDAGADYYLAKGSFQDQDLLDAVIELIGAPDAWLTEK